jgi:hypothetical protein
MVKCRQEKDSSSFMHPQSDYPLWLSSNFAALTGYCQQHHSYDSTLLIKLNLFFSLAAAAACVTFTNDGWNVSWPLAAVVMDRVTGCQQEQGMLR